MYTVEDTMEKLSILMNSFNRPDIIDEAIQSILDSNIPEDLELEIVIVDDHSNDETWNILKKYEENPMFIIHRNPNNLGSGAINWNKGFELSTGDMIIINADDVIFEKDCIKLLYEELKRNDRLTIVLGIWVNIKNMDAYPKSTLKTSKYGLKISKLTGIPTRDTHGMNEHVINPPSLCYKDVLEGLDELYHHFPVNGMREETDLYLRIKKLHPKRKIVVIDKAIRYHVHNEIGGYRMDKKKYNKWTRKNHRTFLRRNFGIKVFYMIPAFQIWCIQKGIRDIIGKTFIDKKKPDH